MGSFARQRSKSGKLNSLLAELQEVLNSGGKSTEVAAQMLLGIVVDPQWFVLCATKGWNQDY